MTEPIVFLLGPAGAGKSTLGQWLMEDLGLLHIELDRYPADGVDAEGLRSEWDAFYLRGQPAGLADVVRQRVRARGASGAVLSFPSALVLSREVMDRAEGYGYRFVILFGTQDECLGSFLDREKATGRGLGRDFWLAHNSNSHAAFNGPQMIKYRLLAFRKGQHRERTDLVAAVRERI